MKSKIKVAITGGIGSGKSTVSKYISDLGYPVFSCDEIYKKIYTTDDFQNQLKVVFPNLVRDGRVDKCLLAEAVFSDPISLERLNALSHPIIMSKLFSQMEESTSDVVFAEVPLLLEVNLDEEFDIVIVVFRDKEKRIEAICNRDQTNRVAAEARIKNQWDYDSDKNKSKLLQDKFFILENNSTEQQLQSNVRKLIDEIISK